MASKFDEVFLLQVDSNCITCITLLANFYGTWEEWGISVDKWELKQKIMMWVPRTYFIPPHLSPVVFMSLHNEDSLTGSVLFLVCLWMFHSSLVEVVWITYIPDSKPVDPIDSFQVWMLLYCLAAGQGKMKQSRKVGWWWGVILIPFNLFNCYRGTSTSRRDKKICGWRDTQSLG